MKGLYMMYTLYFGQLLSLYNMYTNDEYLQ